MMGNFYGNNATGNNRNRPPQKSEGYSVLPQIANLITLLLAWTVLMLMIIALVKHIRKPNQK